MPQRYIIILCIRLTLILLHTEEIPNPEEIYP